MTAVHVLYFYETVTGLGHQRRASGLVNGLIKAGFSVTVASGSFVDADQYFDPAVKLVPLPATRRRKDGVYCFYDADNNLIPDPDHDPAAWDRERMNAILPIAAAQPFDAVMAEWWPFERRRQISGMINTVMRVQRHEFQNRPLLISSVRDVLKPGAAQDSEPEQIKEQEVVRIINKAVDAVFVHGDPALVRFEDGFAAHDDIVRPIIYTGYVVNDEARAADNSYDRDDTILVSCGSGDEGQHFIKAALNAKTESILNGHPWRFIAGPRMPDSERVRLRDIFARSAGHALRPQLENDAPDLPAQLKRADFSLSLAGYNTTMEVLAARVPALLTAKFIAAQDGSLRHFDREQWDRLTRLSTQDMAAIIHPQDTLDPRSFAAEIDRSYMRGRPAARLNMDGAANTAQELARLIETKKMTAAHPQNLTQTAAL